MLGKHYALKSGYSEEIATATFESVLPRGAGDKLPETIPGAILSISDRLDSITGFTLKKGNL